MKVETHGVLRTADDWLATIAKSAAVPPSIAQTVLNKYGIVPQPALPRARKLCIHSIAFDGIKEGPSASGPFEFSWSRLSPGIWAAMSAQNSRGKSSILNVVKSALRGEFPGRIKPDVWKWMSRVEVCIDVDKVGFRVLVEKPAGEEAPQSTRARLSRYEAGHWIDLYDGEPGPSLEAQTASLFMEELAFTRFRAFNAQTKSGHSHGWPAISSALFISEPGRAIFGDVLMDAMPLRLLQLFVGLPWVSTLTEVKTALKQVEANKHQHSTPQTASFERLRNRLNALEADINAARARLARRPDREALRRQLASNDAALVAQQRELRQARARFDVLRNELADASNAWNVARRTLQQVKDEHASRLIFRRLRPVCCPACEASIEARRYEAADAETCALCGSPEAEEALDNERLDSIVADVEAVEASVKRLKVKVGTANRRVLDIEARRDETVRAIETVQFQLAHDEDARLELGITSLEARASELRDLIAEQPEESPSADDVDVAVLKAAETVTKSMFEELQRSVLADVSASLTRLAQKFGVENVEAIRFKMNGTLSVHQGGTETSFGKLAPGERLRVRVAAALAVVEVARTRGFGRHPGLLVLDSPGAQEMASSDFAAMLASVHEAITATKGLQIIVGALARPELTNVIVFENRIHAEGEDYLF